MHSPLFSCRRMPKKRNRDQARYVPPAENLIKTDAELDEADKAALAAKLKEVDDRVKEQRAKMVQAHEEELRKMDKEHVKARNELKKWMQVLEMAEAGIEHIEFRVAWVRDQMERISRENADASAKKDGDIL